MGFHEQVNTINALHKKICAQIHVNNDTKPTKDVIDGAKEILSLCENTLSRSPSIEDFNTILETSGLWKNFLDAHRIRYDFKKPKLPHYPKR